MDALRAVVQGKEAEISELRARLNRALLSAPNRPETEADRQTKWPPNLKTVQNLYRTSLIYLGKATRI